ncbi:MAG: glycerophosphodiester phosphodiesterase family protein [Eubacteriales bacterium]|nr:glycerophosphodiester phosphodiesterase family protein [Eubacteriales bacterium]
MLKLTIILLILVIVLFLLWIWAIKPNKITDERRALVKPFEDHYIAHRGLFSNQYHDDDLPPTAPENSLEAFRLAVEHGYGIELDVQLSADDKLVVFHDGNLKRMCGKKKAVLDCTYEELSKTHLKGSDQTVPFFADVLKIVDGKVPLLIEVKPEGNSCKTAAILNEHMKDYEGVYCMESFDPRAVRWYLKNRPDVLRGQLSCHFNDNVKWYEKIFHLMLERLLTNFMARPDFIAYNHKHKNQSSYRLLRKLYPVFNACWTIKNQKQLDEARDVFSVFIFDSFIPEEKG